MQLLGIKEIVRISFEEGRIADVAWEDNHGYRFGDIHLPMEYFMHMIFGQMDIEDFLFYYREPVTQRSGTR